MGLQTEGSKAARYIHHCLFKHIATRQWCEHPHTNVFCAIVQREIHPNEYVERRYIVNEYHPGKVIKKYRELRGWTQQQLADHWPRSDRGTGVDWHYVQKVEYGNRNIVDQLVLRKIAVLLGIPLWEFGLSEYNPFRSEDIPGGGEHLYSET